MIIPFRIHNDINTTSSKTAEVQAMVLRENTTMRIVYVPEIVDKDENWESSIRGCFIAQRKGKNDLWENIDGVSLSELKNGEWTKFNLSNEEWLNAISYANKLKEMCLKEQDFGKIKRKQILILDENIEKTELKKLIDNLSTSSKKQDFIKQLITNKEIINALMSDEQNVKQLIGELNFNNKNEIYNSINLNMINPKIIKDNLDSGDEKFWQNLFKKNPYYLSSIAPSILQVICDQAYMGTKSINNTGSSITDFLCQQGLGNVCIIEIKTPKTKLVKKDDYRTEVYSPSNELVSAVVQVKEQKDKFLKNFPNTKSESLRQGIIYDAADPKCYLILGNTQNLNPEQLESFNLFRNELRTVEIITYDELLIKLENLYKLLGGY